MIENIIQQGPIQFDPTTHQYLHVPSRKKLTSVSNIISTIYSTKSWDKADPEVVENARERGVAVDRHMSTYVREGTVTVDGESEDVLNRVIIAHRIYEEHFGGLQAESQKIVFSVEDGIAGTLDFWVDRKIIVDLKNTYSIEKSYILQIGAYAEYCPVAPKRCGVIHVSPKVYREGGRWIEYDGDTCRKYWRKAVQWWKESIEMSKLKPRL